MLEIDPQAVNRELLAAAAVVAEDIPAALALCREFGALMPLPGGGQTALRWSTLAAVGRIGLTAARVFEAHTDGLAILAEAGQPVEPSTTWGVFASESPDSALVATGGDGDLTLTGRKPWCSLAGQLDSALVTAVQNGRRRLFRVDELRHAGVRCDPPESWSARGLRTVTSAPVHFDATPARPVGDAEWYLTRPGFAWGGIGVAACWYGGALGLADTLHHRVRHRPDPLSALHVGAVDAALHAAHCALSAAADRIDTAQIDAAQIGVGPPIEPELLALRTRAIVADAVERTLHHVGHAVGPGPLAFDAEHAARVADLTLYVRQHHGERDLAALGTRRLAVEGSGA